MIRIISGICFAVSVGMFFIGKSKQVNEKGTFLKEILSFILYTKDSIRYTRTDILTIKKMSIKKFPSLKFLCEGINKNCFGYEKDVSYFMQLIGKSDLQGQIELCEMYYGLFKSSYDTEKDKVERLSKTYGALGLFGATALFVIFI